MIAQARLRSSNFMGKAQFLRLCTVLSYGTASHCTWLGQIGARASIGIASVLLSCQSGPQVLCRVLHQVPLHLKMGHTYLIRNALFSTNANAMSFCLLFPLHERMHLWHPSRQEDVYWHKHHAMPGPGAPRLASAMFCDPMQISDGQQLLLEVVAIFGSLLLALDRCIPGYTRERALVAHVRLQGGAATVGPSLNATIALAAASASSPGSQLPAGKNDAAGQHSCVSLRHG